MALNSNANKQTKQSLQFYQVEDILEYVFVLLHGKKYTFFFSTGYGDSSGSPSEDGVVSDALFIYRWVRQRKGKSPLFIWGHSLGTGYG